MTGFALLDVGIGIVFVLFTFALIASAAQEILAQGLSLRAANLRSGLERYLMKAQDFPEADAKAVFTMPEILGLEDAGKAEFIPGPAFARAAARAKAGVEAIRVAGETIDAFLDTAPLPAELGEALRAARSDAEAARAAWIARVEADFDAVITAVQNAYRRKATQFLFAIGFALAAAINFDVVGYAGTLVSNQAVRDRIVMLAEVAEKSGETAAEYSGAVGPDGQALTPTEVRERLVAFTGQLTDAGVAVGWHGPIDNTPVAWARRVLSWAVIGFGAMMGAQFWFDLLKSLLAARGVARGQDTERA